MKTKQNGTVQKAFNAAVKEMKKADLAQAEISLQRIQYNYDWTFSFSKNTSFVECELDNGQTKVLENVLRDYALAVFDSDALYAPIVHKRGGYGALATFRLSVGKPAVDINFRALRVDVITQGYLEHKELT